MNFELYSCSACCYHVWTFVHMICSACAYVCDVCIYVAFRIVGGPWAILAQGPTNTHFAPPFPPWVVWTIAAPRLFWQSAVQSAAGVVASHLLWILVVGTLPSRVLRCRCPLLVLGTSPAAPTQLAASGISRGLVAVWLGCSRPRVEQGTWCLCLQLGLMLRAESICLIRATVKIPPPFSTPDYRCP